MTNHYYSLNEYLRREYGQKLYKLSIDGGFTCPNRDGTISKGGCSFCSIGGSGDFAERLNRCSQSEEELASMLDDVLQRGRLRLGQKYKGELFIAYLQSYTNTYGPIDELRALYTQILRHPSFVGLSIGTRPDCLGEDVILLLSQLKKEFPDKFIWVELGLQTCHEESARAFGRGYTNDVFEKAMTDLARIPIPVIVHLILGLPGESKADILGSVRYVSSFSPFGVKLQLLHVLKGTRMAGEYEQGLFETLSMEDYLDILASCVEALPEDIVIHRLTGDGAKKDLLAPLWSGDKKKVLNSITSYFEMHNIYQGARARRDGH